MTPVDLLTEVARLGIRLEVRGEDVHYMAPKGALTSALQDRLRSHQASLRQLLMAPASDLLADDPCPVCGSWERWRWLDDRLLCRICLIFDLAPMTLQRPTKGTPDAQRPHRR